MNPTSFSAASPASAIAGVEFQSIPPSGPSRPLALFWDEGKGRRSRDED